LSVVDVCRSGLRQSVLLGSQMTSEVLKSELLFTDSAVSDFDLARAILDVTKSPFQLSRQDFEVGDIRWGSIGGGKLTGDFGTAVGQCSTTLQIGEQDSFIVDSTLEAGQFMRADLDLALDAGLRLRQPRLGCLDLLDSFGELFLL
jgi:hypothetical protein